MNKVTRYDPYTDSFLDSGEARKERRDQSIFVAIVSYEDTDIYRTLDSLYQNCLYPDRVYTHVVLAHRAHNNNKIFTQEFPAYPNFSYSFAVVDGRGGDPDESAPNTYGALKAYVNKQFNNETFYMTVSSSSRFDPNWDEVLLKYQQTLSRTIGDKFILTGFPRAFLDHDDVVDGFSFYTNHKHGVSFQREDYDGCTVPVSGFPDGYNNDEALSALDGVQPNPDYNKFFFEFNEQKAFLADRRYPKIYGRKFRRSEVIALANGVSHDFLFGRAKDVLRINPSSKNTLDKDAENILGSLRFFKEGYSIYSVRWLPVYKMYNRPWMLNRGSESNLYEDLFSTLTEDQVTSKEIIELIDELRWRGTEDDIFRFNIFFGIDWQSMTYKIKTHSLGDSIAEAINTFTAAYDFSVNENTLHWNKRSL